MLILSAINMSFLVLFVEIYLIVCYNYNILSIKALQTTIDMLSMQLMEELKLMNKRRSFMSNLGAYQWITTVSKKFGGPVQFLTVIALSGYTVIRLSEASAKKVIKIVKTHHEKSKEIPANTSKIYVVKSPGKSNEGLEFAIGDKFRVLASDGDAILIEKLEDSNSPYFVTADFLRSISDYT
jgi:hypothetical protein